MKRQRTSTLTKAERPVLPGEKRHLSSNEKREVKQLIAAAAPRSTAFNTSTGSGGMVTGALASPMTAVLAFTATTRGLAEFQRRGDQIWIHKIKFRCRVVTTATDEHIRFMVVRQPRSGFPPLPVDFNSLLKDNGAGAQGVMSFPNDDQPCEILLDKVIQLGLGTQWGESRIFEFELDWDKRPKKCVYLDNTTTSSPATTVEGDIELGVAARTTTSSMTYTYSIEWSEK